ncbi:beta clamp domain-containing protein [Undibacterium crateris]|uniref:hypothetical protein n=1 Tax=Undibacterium crateris TaxID=2528175 RepID=UPI001389A1F1|nr:hypothetical protein [Undibacterium crateris]NDI85112.1 hypothetical protein [Undibacterium crateris]
MSIIQFQAKYIKMLNSFVAKGGARYYLEGVFISPHKDGGAVLVATNGHAMLCIRDVLAICDQEINCRIDSDAVRKSAKNSQIKAGVMCQVDTETQRLMLLDGTFEIYVQPNKCLITGAKYPVYQRVLPDFAALTEKVPQAISMNVLAHLFGMGLKDTRMQSVRFWSSGDESSPVIVQFGLVPEAVAIMMPMRAVECCMDGLLKLAKHFPKE